jgi:eukaryotic-like serine/threonine-protein kinase
MSFAVASSEELAATSPSRCGPTYAQRESEGGFSAGLVIGQRYRLLNLLGHGGMGLVYEASDVASGARVALKLMRPELLDQGDYLRRFLQEGRCLAALSSEHVVRIIETGQLESGLPFLVMERLMGESLAAFLTRHGPLTSGVATSYARQVCTGLADVHAIGLAHLDVKPTNLFLVSRGDYPPRLEILDFGIARWLRDAPARASDVLIGSPLYASPEQLEDPQAVDERSDIWSVGVVLFEMLTGITPFAGSVSEFYARVLLSPAPSVLTLRPTLDRRLAALIQTCLEKDPSRRFPSVLALGEALRPFAARVSVECLSSPATGRTLTEWLRARWLKPAATSSATAR